MSSFLISTNGGEIYSFSVDTGALRLITDLNIPIADIDYSAQVVGNSLEPIAGFVDTSGFAYQLDVNTLLNSYFGAFGAGANSLELGTAGGVFSAFFGYSTLSTVYVTDLATSTTQALSQLPPSVGVSGDLEIIDGTLITVGTDGILYTTSAFGVPFAAQSVVALFNVEGLASADNSLFIFTSTGDYYTMSSPTSSVQYAGTLNLNGAALTGAATITEFSFGTGGITTFTGSALDDVITGSPDNDTMFGNFGDDSFSGGEGNDVFYLTHGDNYVVGDGGIDTVVVVPFTDDYFISATGMGWVTINWLGGSVKVDSSVEYVQFADGFVAYGDLISTLPTGTLATGWFVGDYTDYGWHLVSGWELGWRLGWNQNTWAYGWNVGWFYGWQSSAAGWFLGWGVGWNLSWYFAAWSYGWGVGWVYQSSWQFGWHNYDGWHYGDYVIFT
ncbi:MAG: hypothetical protein AAF903_11700 [Pseudomonadota bacterium]